ncbi:right-handed parallel beta-helix repeat-containing protein [Rudanella lutea]|uniref:right-handed parallel beta-helix repeat-containing protein n=1 Tax=Rudanella lutea TaxID=451374 RepID=UPI00039CD462|nr:right-handed parallel beta-helix repeat-containing protein [Rudanella lutea]
MRLTLLLTILLVFAQSATGQQIYYVAANGNDANNGLSISSPLQTLAKVSSLPLVPGDQILFRRGDTFRGTLDLTRSGNANSQIKFGAYGSGNKPVLAGSTLLTNWVNSGNSVWQTTCSSCSIAPTGLYVNNISQPLGRFPNSNTGNKGYLTVQNHSGKNSLTSLQPLTSNWTGGEVVVRSNYFIIDRALITQQSGNTLTLSNTSTYDLSDQFGFFIQSHPATLDLQGEWYYNPANKQISYYSSQANPNTQSISVTTASNGIILRGCTYIAFEDLIITETLNHGIVGANNSNISIKNCEITNAGENGIYFGGSGNSILLESNTIVDCNNNGFQIDGYSNFIFRANTLRKIGTSPGRGKSGDAQYIGFIANTISGATIEDNKVDSVGYTAINFPKNNATIQRNVISNFCLVKSDGGGLYVTNNAQETMGNVILQDNLVFNGVGAPDGSPDGFLGANGIYLDECINSVIVRSNTTFNCGLYGIYLHGTQNSIVENNIAYDNKSGQFVMDYTGICPTTGNSIQNNIFTAKGVNQYTAIYDSYFSDLSSFGTFTNNVYARPIEDVQTLRLSYRPPNGTLFDPKSLTEWQNLYGKDLNSTRSPITYKNFFFNAYTGPERVIGGNFTTGTGYGSGGPFIFSDFNNGQGTWDNSNRIDGGSLNLNFTTITNNPGASLYAAQVINSVSAQKDYLIEFDAVSTVPNRLVQVYIQPQFAPFTPLVDTRPAVVVGTTPQHYQVVVRPNRDLQNALSILRVFENSEPLFIDNLSFREVDVNTLDPNNVIQLIYNPTPRDSIIAIGGTFRDARNQVYSRQVSLPAYKSLVLFRDDASKTYPVDLNLTLYSDVRSQTVNKPLSYRLKIRNNTNRSLPSIGAQWTLRIPSSLQVINSTGLSFTNNILSGTVRDLRPLTDTTFVFSVQPTTNGIFRLSAQIASSSYPDPDSTPNSGIADGEDDMAESEIRTKDLVGQVYASPNPLQRPVPAPITNEPVPVPSQCDLSLRTFSNKNSLSINETVTITIVIVNRGGAYTSNIQLQNVLPTGLAFSTGANWIQNGNILTATIPNLNAGESISLSFQARAVSRGQWINNSQVVASSTIDTDSVPNNGFSNGEDDQHQLTLLVR